MHRFKGLHEPIPLITALACVVFLLSNTSAEAQGHETECDLLVAEQLDKKSGLPIANGTENFSRAHSVASCCPYTTACHKIWSLRIALV